MKRAMFFFLIFSLFSCGGTYKVTSPMAHMPAKWKPYFQKMAILTYREYRELYTEDMAVCLTNEKMAAIMLRMPEIQFKRFEKDIFNSKK